MAERPPLVRDGTGIAGGHGLSPPFTGQGGVRATVVNRWTRRFRESGQGIGGMWHDVAAWGMG